MLLTTIHLHCAKLVMMVIISLVVHVFYVIVHVQHARTLTPASYARQIKFTYKLDFAHIVDKDIIQAQTFVLSVIKNVLHVKDHQRIA